MSSDSERPMDTNPHAKRIVLAHGGGGQLTDDLIAQEIKPRFSNDWLDARDDAATFSATDCGGETSRLAFTTDSYVVQPLEFPGGDIGELAVSGTVNDLAVCGATPRFLSLALILEEGLELTLLRRILDSIASCAKRAGVRIVTGDTKVVARGQADGMYINTAGVGEIREGVSLGVQRVQPGDCVIVSGTMADHGLAVMLQRESASVIQSKLESDAAPLTGLISAVLDVPGVVFLRDPTRGGLAGVLSDLAEASGHRVAIDENEIPVRSQTRYAAEMLGIDPLDVANEGKVVVVARKESEAAVLAALTSHELGKSAATIGHVEKERDGLAVLLTEVGGSRILQKPYGEELPRIC